MAVSQIHAGAAGGAGGDEAEVEAAAGGLALAFFTNGNLSNEFMKLASNRSSESDVTPGVVPTAGTISTATWTNDNTGPPGPNAGVDIYVNGSVAASFTATGETGVAVLAPPIRVAAGDRVGVFGAEASGSDRLRSPVVTLYF